MKLLTKMFLILTCRCEICLAWSVNFGVEFWLSLINYTFTIYVIKPAVRQMSGVKSINFDMESIEVIFRQDEII